MRNCCGPFKRGKPAKAVNPNQQCFADCCGNLCPPDGCCETVSVEYQCGCGCDCGHKGFNFNGLRFKRKRGRRKKGEIPTFSKKTLAANGFTFADGTIPTASSSSSSTEIYWCVKENRNDRCEGGGCAGWIVSGSECIYTPASPPGNEVYGGKLDCECAGLNQDSACEQLGQVNLMGVGSLAASDCGRVCIADNEYNPEIHEKISGPYGSKEDCEANCCAASSSSSSSSCICAPFNIELSTDGCCLYLGPEGVEAVGPGKVTASSSGDPLPDCTVEVLLNGEARNEIEVGDGDIVEVDVRTFGGCECCETQRECSTQTSSLWIQKSKKDRKTVVMDKDAIKEKVRLAVSRVRKRRNS